MHASLETLVNPKQHAEQTNAGVHINPVSCSPSVINTPAPVRRPWPCLHRGLRSCGRPCQAPTRPGCCRHYPSPRRPSSGHWQAKVLSLGSGKNRTYKDLHRFFLIALVAYLDCLVG